MVDTIRTLTDLLTNLLQDGQAPGSIAPQDIRDLTVSLGQVPYGSLYLSSAIETVIPGVSTYVKALGTTTGNNFRNFDMPTDNRLRYTGSITFHLHMVCSLSMMSAANQKLAGFKLYKYDDSLGSGAVIDGSEVKRFIATGADEGSTALHWDEIMDTNDYLELHVANLTDGTDITVSNIYLYAMGMPL